VLANQVSVLRGTIEIVTNCSVLFLPQSVILTASHPIQDRTDTAAGVGLVGRGVTGLPTGRGPRNEHVEIEVADECCSPP
jgi:hypothetical protein